MGGLHELRAAIAAHYNRLYRQDGKKQYTAANVSVAGGGRGVLARLFAALSGRVGYRVPDYAAYQDLFESALGRVTPVHVKTAEEDNFAITGAALRKAASAPEGQRLDGLLISNPCNPTGDVVSGKKLAESVAPRRVPCVMVRAVRQVAWLTPCRTCQVLRHRPRHAVPHSGGRVLQPLHLQGVGRTG